MNRSLPLGPHPVNDWPLGIIQHLWTFLTHTAKLWTIKPTFHNKFTRSPFVHSLNISIHSRVSSNEPEINPNPCWGFIPLSLGVLPLDADASLLDWINEYPTIQILERINWLFSRPILFYALHCTAFPLPPLIHPISRVPTIHMTAVETVSFAVHLI